MAIDPPPSEQEDVVVIGDGPPGKFLLVKSGTLGLRLCWSHEVGQSKEGEQLLKDRKFKLLYRAIIG